MSSGFGLVMFSSASLIFLSLISESAGVLQCASCPYNSTASLFDLHPEACNSTNGNVTGYTVTCPEGTHFCIKIEGKFGVVNSSSTSYFSGVRRGCAPASVLQTFCPSGRSYIAGGYCEDVEKRSFNRACNGEIISNETTEEAYFMGSYCLCETDNCNAAANSWSLSSLVLIASLVATAF